MVLEGSEDKVVMSRAKKFDAREYFFATVRWFDQWPICAIEQFEQAGFKISGLSTSNRIRFGSFG
jgi:hypothetical protein